MSEISEDTVRQFLVTAYAKRGDNFNLKDALDNDVRVGAITRLVNTGATFTAEDIEKTGRFSSDIAKDTLAFIKEYRGEDPSLIEQAGNTISGYVAGVGSAISDLFNGSSDPAQPAIMRAAQQGYQTNFDNRIDNGINAVSPAKSPGT